MDMKELKFKKRFYVMSDEHFYVYVGKKGVYYMNRLLNELELNERIKDLEEEMEDRRKSIFVLKESFKKWNKEFNK